MPTAMQVLLNFQLQLSRVPEGDVPIYGRSGVFDPVDLSTNLDPMDQMAA